MKTIPLLLAGLTGISLAAEPSTGETPPKGLASSDWHSIRAAYEAGRHAVHRQENGTLTARNPGQQWRTEFNGRGFKTFEGVRHLLAPGVSVSSFEHPLPVFQWVEAGDLSEVSVLYCRASRFVEKRSFP